MQKYSLKFYANFRHLKAHVDIFIYIFIFISVKHSNFIGKIFDSLKFPHKTSKIMFL